MAYIDGIPTDPERAMEFFSVALPQHHECAELHYDYAEFLQRVSGDRFQQQALESYQRALSLRPNWMVIYPEWTRTLRLLGEAFMYPFDQPAEGEKVLSAYVSLQHEIAASHPLGRSTRILSHYNSPAAIGHLCIETDLFVKMQQLGWLPPFEALQVVTGPVCNQSALDYWKQYIRVVQHPAHTRDLEQLRKWLFYDTWYVQVPGGRTLPAHHAYAVVQREWERQGRGPLLTLGDAHRERGRQVLRELGMPDDAWFVCAHAREVGYYKEADDNTTSAFRNGGIESYFPAMRRIVEHGGWVIRVGDPTMSPIPEMPNVIDYVHTPHHSDWMDVFLAAECRFFLGCESGLMNLPGVFGRPCALVGWTVMYSLPWFEHDLFITRIPSMPAEGRMLTWSDMSRPPFSSGQRERWIAAGLSMEANTPEEVLELVEEMLERVDGRTVESAEDAELQRRARRTIDSPFSTGTGARVGRAFMRKYGKSLFVE